MGLFRDIKDDLTNRYGGIDSFLRRAPNPKSPIHIREYGSQNMTARVWTETLYRETARASADSQTSPAHRIKGLVSDEIHELDESNWEGKWEASSGHDIVDEYLYEKGLDPKNDPWLAFRRLSGERVATDLFNRGGWDVPKGVGHEAGQETNPVRQRFNEWVTNFNNNVVLPYFDAMPDLEARLITSSRAYRDNRSAARISAGLQSGSMLDRHGDAVLALIKESGEKGVSLDIGIFQFESPVILNALLEREGGFKNIRMTTNRFNKNAATGEASISQLEHLMNRTLNFLRSSSAFGDDYKFINYNDETKDYAANFGFNPNAPHFSHNVMAHYKIAVMGIRDKTGNLITKIDESNRNTMKMVIGSANWTQSALGRMVNRGGDPIDLQGFNIEHGFFLHSGMIGRELDQSVFDELMYQSGRAVDWVHQRKLDTDVGNLGEDFRNGQSGSIESRILTNTGTVNQQGRLLNRLVTEGGKGVIMANLLGDMSHASTSDFLQRLVETIKDSQGKATFKILIGANPTASGTTINTSNRALILKYQKILAEAGYNNHLEFTQVQTRMVHGKSMMFEIGSGDSAEHYAIIGSTNFDNSMMRGQYSGLGGTGTAPILNLGILVSGKEFKMLGQQMADMEKLHKVYGMYGFLQAGVVSPWENWEAVGWDKLANKYNIDKRLISKGGLVQTGFDAEGKPVYQPGSAKLSVGGRFNVNVGGESLGIDVGNLFSLTVAAHKQGFKGTLYVQELGKFVGPTKGILGARTQEELDSFGKEGRPQDFSPEETLIAGISAAQKRVQYELQAMAETIGAKALQTMMADPLFKGYFRRTAKTIIREQFQNFQGFEPGVAAFEAKRHARLAFSMSAPGQLDLWEQLMIDVRKIEESLLANPITANRAAKKINLNAWRMMFMAGSLSSFNKSGRASPGLFYEMGALNTMPFTSMLFREGNKDEDGNDRPEFFMLLPGSKLEQLPQRLQNAMSTRALTPADSIIDAKNLNKKIGVSRFRSTEKANEKGIIFRGYALGGFPGDNAYVVAEQFRGLHVADESYRLNVKFSNAMLVKTSTGLIMQETLDALFAKDSTMGRVLSDGRYYISSAGLRALNHQLPVAETYIEGTQLIQRQFASLGTEKWANSVSTLNEDVGLILDMNSRRIVQGAGTDTFSINGVLTRDIISGDRLMYPIKAPVAGIQQDSRMVATINNISYRTNQNVHEAFGLNQANIFFGSGNVKTGDLFIQTGIHTLTTNDLWKDQLYQLREAGIDIAENRTAKGIINQEGMFLKKSFEGSRALFSKLDVFIDKDLSKDVKELLEFDLNKIFDEDGNINDVAKLNKFLNRSRKLLEKSSRFLSKDPTRQISISKDPHHVAAAALAFSIHAASSIHNLQKSNLDVKELTKLFRYKPGTGVGIAGERDSLTYMEQQILNFVPVYGVSNFSASAVPMSSRDRVSFLNYHLGNYTDAFMDMFALSDRVKDRQTAYTELVLGGMLRAGGTSEISYAGEEFNVMTRFIQGFDAYDDPVTGKRVEQGVEITINNETKTVGVFERELQISRELQGHGKYYVKDVKDNLTGEIKQELVYLQESSTVFPGLRQADVVRDKDLIKARIGSLREEFTAIEAALQSRLNEPGKVISQISGSASSAAIVQFNSIQERAGVGSRTMLVNRIGYEEGGDFKFDATATGKDARLQTVQVKFLSPKALKTLGAFEDYSHEILRLQYQIERNMGVLEKIRSVRASDGSSQVINLMTQQEQSTYVQMMQMIGDLANYQKLAAGTDLQKILGGELQISGRNMVVGTLPELERGVMIIGDEMWNFMKTGAKEEMMSALRRSVMSRRKEMIDKYGSIENVPLNERASVRGEVETLLRQINADKSYFSKVDLLFSLKEGEKELTPEEVKTEQDALRSSRFANQAPYSGPARRLVRLSAEARGALGLEHLSDIDLQIEDINRRISGEISAVFGSYETSIHAAYLDETRSLTNEMFNIVRKRQTELIEKGGKIKRANTAEVKTAVKALIKYYSDSNYQNKMHKEFPAYVESVKRYRDLNYELANDAELLDLTQQIDERVQFRDNFYSERSQVRENRDSLYAEKQQIRLERKALFRERREVRNKLDFYKNRYNRLYKSISKDKYLKLEALKKERDLQEKLYREKSLKAIKKQKNLHEKLYKDTSFNDFDYRSKKHEIFNKEKRLTHKAQTLVFNAEYRKLDSRNKEIRSRLNDLRERQTRINQLLETYSFSGQVDQVSLEITELQNSETESQDKLLRLQKKFNEQGSFNIANEVHISNFYYSSDELPVNEQIRRLKDLRKQRKAALVKENREAVNYMINSKREEYLTEVSNKNREYHELHKAVNSANLESDFNAILLGLEDKVLGANFNQTDLDHLYEQDNEIKNLLERREINRQLIDKKIEQVKGSFNLKTFLNTESTSDEFKQITETLIKSFGQDATDQLLTLREKLLEQNNNYATLLEEQKAAKEQYRDTHLQHLLLEKQRLRASKKGDFYGAAEQIFDDILEDSRYRDSFLRGAFQRAGSPMGPLGIVVNKILKVSEYNEYQTKEYGDVSIKLDAQMNRRAVFVNMGAMMFNLGDFDGDTASIAQLRKFAELNTLRMMNSSALEHQEREILNRARIKLGYSAEELVIEHTRGYTGWSELFSEREMYIGSEKEYAKQYAITSHLDSITDRISAAQALFHNIALTAEELRKTNLSGKTVASIEEIRNQRLMQVERGNALYTALLQHKDKLGRSFTEAELDAFMDFRRNISRMHDIAVKANRYVEDQNTLTKDFNDYFLRYANGRSKEEVYKEYFNSGHFRNNAREMLQKSFKTFTDAAGGTDEKLNWNAMFGFFVQTNYAANLLIGKTFNIEIATLTAMKRDSSAERNRLAKEAINILGISSNSLKYTDSRQVLDILEAFRISTDSSIEVNASLRESSLEILTARGITPNFEKLAKAKEVLEKQKQIAERELKISGVVLAIQQIAREAIKPPASYRSLLEQFKGLSNLVGANEAELSVSAIRGLLNDERVKGIVSLYELSTGRAIDDSRTKIDFSRKTEADWREYHGNVKGMLYAYYSTQIEAVYAEGVTRDKGRLVSNAAGGPPVFETEALAEEAFRNAEALFKGQTNSSTFSGQVETEIMRSMSGVTLDANDPKGYREKTLEEIQREVYEYAELARQKAKASTLTREHYEQGTFMYYAKQKADESARLIINAHLDATPIYEGEYLYKRALAGDSATAWKQAIGQVDAKTKLSVIFQMSSRAEITAEGGMGRALIDVFQHFTSADELFEAAKEASDSRDYANQLKALYEGFSGSNNMNLAIARAAKAAGVYGEEEHQKKYDEDLKTLEAKRDAFAAGTSQRNKAEAEITSLHEKFTAEKEIREESRGLLSEMVKSAGGGAHMGFTADRLSTTQQKSNADAFFEQVESGIGKMMKSTAVTGATANVIVPALLNTLIGGVSGSAGERLGNSLIEFGGIALAYANPITMIRHTFHQSSGEGTGAATARAASVALAFGVGAGLGHVAGRATFAHMQSLPNAGKFGRTAGLLTLLASAGAGFLGGTAVGLASESLLMRMGITSSRGPEASPIFRGEAGDPDEHVDLSELGFELVEGGEGGGHSEVVTLTTEAGEVIVQEFWVQSAATRDSHESSEDSSNIEADLDTVVSSSSFESFDFSNNSSVLDYGN